MLTKLSYKVEIKNPAKTLEGKLDFTTGLTGIVGANGKGKSMVLEMIQYALFGTQALRGAMDGYAKIEVSLLLELKGQSYLVTRTKSTALIQTAFVPEGSEVAKLESLATGTKPVNAKIEELFGYSSDVFRIANVCNQGKIEELGDMKPTARKQLVDETVGLNSLDELGTFIDDERKRLKTGISTIEGMITIPIVPVNPGYDFESTYFKAERDRLQTIQRQRDLVASVANRVVPMPPEVKLHLGDHLLADYVGFQQARANLMTEYTLLDGQLQKLPKPVANLVTKLEEDDDKAGEYQSVLDKSKALVAEIRFNVQQESKYKFSDEWTLTLEQIEVSEAINKMADRWDARQALIKKRVPHDCPACAHHWEDEDPRIKSDYADVPEDRPLRKHSEGDLAEARRQIKAKADAQPFIEAGIKAEAELKALDNATAAARLAAITATRKAFNDSQVAVAAAARRTEIETRLAEIDVAFAGMKDYSATILNIENQRKLFHRYEVQMEAYKTARAEIDKAAKELEGFDADLDAKIRDRDISYTIALTYETNLAAYNKAKEAYDKAVASLELLREELKDWENGKDAVATLRKKVKGYLLPSLNSVASTLINQMTGGELTWIVVNEQFEISVGGQSIETLSGAGKAVANLALRIALGQVLTNRVFSVMMLDEIDAACDEDRAKYIAGCLMNLTKTIKQVIQVSHKQGLPANQYVRL